MRYLQSRVTILPHAELHLWFLCPTCMVSGSLASAPQSVSLTHPDHQTIRASQTTIQNVDSEMHFRMQLSPKLVTYVTLVPLMDGSERSHPIAAVPPWGTGSWLGFSVKTWICIAPAAYLYSCRDEQQMDVIIACQCALAHLVYTRSRLVSWSKMPIHRSPPWCLGSLLQGMRVTYLTETFHCVSI